MTLEQIEELLPNGLHDAQILTVSMDYETTRLVLRINVLVGLPEQRPPAREIYRQGFVTFRDVKYFAAEVPQEGSAFRHPGAIWFSYERTHPDELAHSVGATLPGETLFYTLFILDWLSHIRVAVADATFSWEEEVPFLHPTADAGG